jgi:outer membrane protein TolC
LIDYLDAQRALREALRTQNRARFDYRISLFQYEAAVGTLAPAQGKDVQ